MSQYSTAIGGGGTFGTITWNGYTLDSGFTAPADTKRRLITFAYDGSRWYSQSVTGDM